MTPLGPDVRELVAELRRVHEWATRCEGEAHGPNHGRLHDLCLDHLPALLDAAEAGLAAQDRIAELEAERERLRAALAFYADPESYVGIAFLADPPCGEFADDCDDEHEEPVLLGVKPGKRARAALREQEGS